MIKILIYAYYYIGLFMYALWQKPKNDNGYVDNY
jgi:hypothetical protein